MLRSPPYFVSAGAKLTLYDCTAQAQPHLPSGALPAGDTTTAARAEAQQATSDGAQQVHETAEHTKGVAEHAASSAHVCFPSSFMCAITEKVNFDIRLGDLAPLGMRLTLWFSFARGWRRRQTRRSQKGRRTFRRPPVRALDTSRRPRVSPAAQFPLQRWVSTPLRGSRARSYFCIQSYLPASLKGVITGSATESAQGGPGSNAPSNGVPTSSALESGPHTVDNTASEVHARRAVVKESE